MKGSFQTALIAAVALACSTAASAGPADVWKKLHRPLDVPRVAGGTPCPASSARLDGIVRPRIEGDVQNLSMHLDFPPRRTSAFYGSPWSAQKVVWEVRGSYRGPILIRGRRLDGSGAVRFERGQIPAKERRIQRAKSAAGTPRVLPSIARISSPGCYAFQVDGVGFSRVFVFEAKVNGPATADEALDALRTRGLPMRPAGPFRSMGFDYLVHITGQRFENPGGEIVLWQFPTFKAVHNLLLRAGGWAVVVPLKPSGMLSAAIFCVLDPANPAICHFYDVPPPHWYRNGTALALYLGTDPAMLKTMENLLGEQFAGE